MLKDITIGQYFPGDTIIHRLDPRVKIIIISLFIASLFFINSFIPYIFILGFILLVIKISEVPLKFILKGIRPLFFIILIMVALTYLFITIITRRNVHVNYFLLFSLICVIYISH